MVAVFSYSRYWKIRFKEVDIDQLLPIIKTNPQTSGVLLLEQITNLSNRDTLK